MRRRAGRVQQLAAASRGAGSTRARGARRRTGVRVGGAHGGGNRRGATDEEGPVCDQEELHLHFRRGRHLLLGRRFGVPLPRGLPAGGGGGSDGDDGASVVEGAGQMLEGRDKVSARSGRSSRGRGEERMEEADDVWGRMSVRRE